MIIQSSWDDGHPKDIQLLELLREFPKIPAIFYIPVINFERKLLSNEDIKIISSYYEIGGHTYTHKALTLLPKDSVMPEIIEGKKHLEALIGKKIKSFCYPKGRYNEYVKSKVSQAGFEEARTTRVLSILPPDDPLETHTTIHIYQRKEYNGENWLNMAYKFFNKAKETNGYFHLWGHSWEIDRDENWGKLKELLKYINENL